MKKIILKACRHSAIFSPLADEENQSVHPKLVGDESLAKSLINWQQEYNQTITYSNWSLYQKLSFEREGLRLAQLLSASLPREIDFSYYSNLYEQGIKFYQHG